MLDILVTPWDVELEHGHFVGAAVSRQLTRFWKHFTVEAEVGGGYRFGMPRAGTSPETWGAVFLRYDGFPWNDHLYTTVAICTGLDYVGRVPDAEHPEDHPPSEARLLHYLGPEITFALPKYRQHELVFRIHHRSSGYGLMWDVNTGSNVLLAGYRYRF
ncbi:MAG: hypothetical protein HZA91_12640 [Verrucomicrobia bacterium]|nr:hypothetical protein [Verrucomicrobiota bacterium]